MGLKLNVNACHSYLNKLIVLNNKIRILQRQKVTIPVMTLYHNYNRCLPISLLHIYQLLLLVHKWMYNKSKLPEVFHEYFAPNTLIHTYCTGWYTKYT